MSDFIETNLRRNWIANFFHGVFGQTGFRLINVPTFIPAYLLLLTGSPFLVGLGLFFQNLGSVFSPFFGATLMGQRDRILPPTISIGWLMRAQLAGLAIAGWFLSGALQVVATMFFLFLYGVFMGAQRVAFNLLLGKVIPKSRRGHLIGWRNLFGGGLAALLSFWAGAWLIENNIWGNGYATTFFISFLLTSIGLVAFFILIREPVAMSSAERRSPWESLNFLPKLMQDTKFRTAIIAQSFAAIGRMALPFCILFAGEKIEIGGQTLGLITLVYLMSATFSNLLWGYLGDKKGFLSVLLGAVIFWILGYSILILAGSQLWVLLSFIFLGMGMPAYFMSSNMLPLEIGDENEGALQVAITTTVDTTLATLGPILLGACVLYFGYSAPMVGILVALATSFLIIKL